MWFKMIYLSILLSLCLCVSNVELKDFATLSHLKPKSSKENQLQAVKDLISRIIPQRSDDFIIEIDSDLTGDIPNRDSFKIQNSDDGKIKISATTGVTAATGFHHYLKYFCNCHISWESSQLNLPEVLPKVNLTIALNDVFRYYQNVCTTSYSFVWWNWEQWEKHIDWMALNAFNLVLAFNGQEAIWNRVYKRFNLTREDIDEQFAGPAFLSWLRMGNVRGFAGPLSDAWHQRSLVLQKQILERMRSLGMVTVLPAFAGHVPRAFKRIFPNASMVKLGTWNKFEDNYCCPYFVDPSEELFNEIGKAFMSEQIEEFGSDHVYSCDSFNENTPANDDLTYLRNVGQSIYKAMTDTDPQAIWLLQGWMFYYDEYWDDIERVQAFLNSIPSGKMIVLDLQAEQFPQYDRLEQYFGQPYIWCMLHNFGGTLNIFGSSSIINEEPIRARNMENSTMIGTGLTPEGINQNYVIYDLMTETAWRRTSVNLTEWFQMYSVRRYGESDENAKEAWRILQRTLYDFKSLVRMRGKHAIIKSPSLKIQPYHWYDRSDLVLIWENLLKASDRLGNNSGYRHDLVDVTREFLQKQGDLYYDQLAEAVKNSNLTGFNEVALPFLSIFDDLETILSTSEAFLLGRWIKDAQDCASSEEERQLFKNMARNQISLWGPNGEIMDYAAKQWAGVVQELYSLRWSSFLGYAQQSLIFHQPFDQGYVSKVIFQTIEEPFTRNVLSYPTETTGDAVDVSYRIWNKWIDSQRKTKFSKKQRH